MSNFRASVVIPAYNGAAYLGEAIESVLLQTYAPFEIIVIDNGSTDQTEKIAKSFSLVNYQHLSLSNVASARQFGANLASGDFIAFLDQDDIWVPDKLEVQTEFLDANPEVDYVIGQQILFLEPGIIKPHWLKSSLLEKPLPGYLPSALILRSMALKKTGDFDSSFLMASDVQWFFKARDMGLRIGSVNQVVVRKRIHDQNQSDQVAMLQNEILRVIKQSLSARRANHV